jgi:hypothetical protein
MKKSKERIAIEKAIGECQSKIDTCSREIVELTNKMDRINDEKKLHWAYKVFLLNVIGMPADPVAGGIHSDFDVSEVQEKPRWKRKPKAGHAPADPPAQDRYRCTNGHVFDEPVNYHDEKVCRVCGVPEFSETKETVT